MSQKVHILIKQIDRTYITLFKHVVGNVLENACVTGHNAVLTGGRQLFAHGKGTCFEQVAQVGRPTNDEEHPKDQRYHDTG